MTRTPIIAGNWKMNITPSQAQKLVAELIPLMKDSVCEVVLCTPDVDLATVHAMLGNTKIKLGAQNMHWELKGAYTGEISAEMLTDMGVEYCIIGHSERRRYFNETNQTVNAKVKVALSAGLIPIICVGETIEQRKAGVTEALLRTQILEGLYDVEKKDAKKIVIAYEPVWAIGTGITASPEEANEGCAVIRKTLAQRFGDDTAEEIRILYGGSMTPGNAAGLIDLPDIDGGLVGGASLVAADFAKIANYRQA